MGGRHARSAADTIEDFQICMVLRPLDSYLGFDIDSDLERQILLADSIDRAVFQKVTRQNNSGFIVFTIISSCLVLQRFREIFV